MVNIKESFERIRKSIADLFERFSNFSKYYAYEKYEPYDYPLDIHEEDIKEPLLIE